MSARASRGTQPLVALVCTVPMLHEALAAALESIAEVRAFPARRGDTAGLLRWVRPDAVVVDTDEEAEAATAFARESNSPLVHVSLREGKVRVLHNGNWDEPENGKGASPEAIRNILAGGIFGPGRRRR